MKKRGHRITSLLGAGLLLVFGISQMYANLATTLEMDKTIQGGWDEKIGYFNRENSTEPSLLDSKSQGSLKNEKTTKKAYMDEKGNVFYLEVEGDVQGGWDEEHGNFTVVR